MEYQLGPKTGLKVANALPVGTTAVLDVLLAPEDGTKAGQNDVHEGLHVDIPRELLAVLDTNCS